MTRIELTDEMKVDLIVSAGGDWLATDAARNSAKFAKGRGERDATKRDVNLIDDLTSLKHGMPFGHGLLTFHVEAPIFVLREVRTHKVGVRQDEVEWCLISDTTDTDVAYSEGSARYRPLVPKFWSPGVNRRYIRPEGFSPMRPEMELPDLALHEENEFRFQNAYQACWTNYEHMLADGVAPEVARAVMPVGVYSSLYISFNPLSMLRFLSLRIHSEKSAYPSYPQYEIQEVALKMEEYFKDLWPATWENWDENGRLAF